MQVAAEVADLPPFLVRHAGNTPQLHCDPGAEGFIQLLRQTRKGDDEAQASNPDSTKVTLFFQVEALVGRNMVGILLQARGLILAVTIPPASLFIMMDRLTNRKHVRRAEMFVDHTHPAALVRRLVQVDCLMVTSLRKFLYFRYER